MVTPELLEEVARQAINRILDERDVLGMTLGVHLGWPGGPDACTMEEHTRKESISDEDLAVRVEALQKLTNNRSDPDFVAMVFRCPIQQAAKALGIEI
jgi:hypothetical protein